MGIPFGFAQPGGGGQEGSRVASLPSEMRGFFPFASLKDQNDKQRHQQRQRKNTGILHCVQDDDLKKRGGGLRQSGGRFAAVLDAGLKPRSTSETTAKTRQGQRHGSFPFASLKGQDDDLKKRSGGLRVCDLHAASLRVTAGTASLLLREKCCRIALRAGFSTKR